MLRETPQGKRAQAEAMFAALNRRDFEALGDMPFHPDMEFHSAFAVAEGGIYHGIQGLREWAETVDSAFDGLTPELLEYREIDEERALVTVRITARAKISGVPIDERFAQI